MNEIVNKLIPVSLATFKRAGIKGLKIVHGTDAVDGAILRNSSKACSEGPAIISVTYLSAESLKMCDKIGTIPPGLQADLIAAGINASATEGARRVLIFRGSPK